MRKKNCRTFLKETFALTRIANKSLIYFESAHRKGSLLPRATALAPLTVRSRAAGDVHCLILRSFSELRCSFKCLRGDLNTFSMFCFLRSFTCPTSCVPPPLFFNIFFILKAVYLEPLCTCGQRFLITPANQSTGNLTWVYLSKRTEGKKRKYHSRRCRTSFISINLGFWLA